MNAARAIDAALLTLAHRDQRTPCQGRDAALWLSEYYAWRAVAIPLCAGCDLLAYCHEYATELKTSFGVWAARDWTPTTRKKAAA